MCPQPSKQIQQDEILISSQESHSEVICSLDSSPYSSEEELSSLIIFESIQVREGDQQESIPDLLMAESAS